MPIIYKSAIFTDVALVDYTSYTANAGDVTDVTLKVYSSCCFTFKQQDGLTIDELTKEIYAPNKDWYKEGFRVNDLITITKNNALNQLIVNYTSTITSISGNSIFVTITQSANDVKVNEGEIAQIFIDKSPSELLLKIGWIDNSEMDNSPSFESLIDSEIVKFSVVNIQSMVQFAFKSIIQVGKQSGSYAITNAQIQRQANSNFGNSIRREYWISFKCTNIALLFPEEMIGSKKLKLIIGAGFKILSSDANFAEYNYVEKANTGYLNEAYSDQASQVISFPTPPTEVYFNEDTTIPYQFSVLASDNINKFEVGASYLSLNESYNFNKQQNQNKLLKLLKTSYFQPNNTPLTINSDTISATEYYTIIVNAMTSVISAGVETYTGTITFKPNYLTFIDSFGKFIEKKATTDRKFVIWIKVGNTNCVLYNDSLYFKKPLGKLIEIYDDIVYVLNHDDNNRYNTIPMNNIGMVDAIDVNVEDDLAFIADFILDGSINNKSVNAEIVCKYIFSNINEEFSLEKISFDTSTQTMQPITFINSIINVNNNLPDDSAKKSAYLYFNKNYDSDIPQIVVRIYYPFIIRWEYWLTQLNATAYFKAKSINNKNWFNYTINYAKLYVKLTRENNGVVDYYYKEILVRDYDVAPDVTTTIEVIDTITNTPVDTIVKGKSYTIKATHFKTGGVWGAYPYGQITIEPEESQPRYLLSTEITENTGGNSLLVGNINGRLDELRPNANTIIYTCGLNNDKISLNNYCIGSKISEQGISNNPIFEIKITEDNIDKITEDSITKQIE